MKIYPAKICINCDYKKIYCNEWYCVKFNGPLSNENIFKEYITVGIVDEIKKDCPYCLEHIIAGEKDIPVNKRS